MPSRFPLVAGLVVLLLAAGSGAIVLLARPAPLAVVEADPADGTRGVPTAARVTVTFNRPIDEVATEKAVRVAPDVEGLVSAAGRRLAFTPKGGFRPDTEYVLTVGEGARDRGGRGLAVPHVVRFRTRAPGLVARMADGRLVRLPVREGQVAGPAEDLGVVARAPFDVGPTGEVVYVREDGRAVVTTGLPGMGPLTVPLSRGLVVEDLLAAPRGRSVLLLALEADWPPVPFLVRSDAAAPEVRDFGPRPGLLPEALVVEKLKRSLNHVVYQQETAAFTPDGRAAVVRDSTYDLAVFGLDGERRASLGPFLAVGDISPRGDAVYVVDVDVADAHLRRQVLAFGRDATSRALSDPSRDSHAPRASPTGDRVAYLAGEADRPPAERRYGVEVVEVASGEHLRLTDPPPGETDLDARWSPDGAWLAVRRAPVGRPEAARVLLVSAAGGEAREVREGVVDVRWDR